MLLYAYMSNACHTNKYNICANDADSHNTLYNNNNTMNLSDETIMADKNKSGEI